ncbi:hypothetical protein CJF31_00007765 [Rutstroemia sp. NJR-2017a BVV2]|nr:hypothetical protein CJF31_00005335 [Rutstroemia sp. NJR-2017a BVV2]PQE21939.1 hypothetical protein CJF31_00007765 [Rutstroemia sp. NJR-2017a BVV2]
MGDVISALWTFLHASRRQLLSGLPAGHCTETRH